MSNWDKILARMDQESNYLCLGMDACRWDSFCAADAPVMKTLGKPRMAISSAGYTPPSMLSLLMNAPQYLNPQTKFIPQLPHFIWIPQLVGELGYYRTFITPNQTMLRYNHVFNHGWSEVDFYWNNFRYSIDKDVDKVIKLWNTVEKKKFVVLLSMETHGPFAYSPDLDDEHFNDWKKTYDTSNQILAVEALDKEYGRLFEAIADGKTHVLIFSDHGTLDPVKEGAKGHAFSVYHRKLFEVPSVRGRI